MTKCHSCATDMLSTERFCRNCGAPSAVQIEDLAETREFEPAYSSVAAANAGQHASERQFFAPASNTYPLPPGSDPSLQTASLIKGFQKLAAKKIVWLLAFLLLLVFIPSGLAIGRSVIRSRRAARAEQARDAELARQRRQIKQAETAHRTFEESVRNALGFNPSNVSVAEYPDIQGIFVASLTSEYGPAAVAHIQAGDVLIEFGGQPVRNGIDLAQLLEPLKPGAEVGLKLYRDGERVASTIRIADRSTPPLQPKIEAREQGFLGLGDVTRRCCVPDTRKWGLEVHRVIDNSPADLAGLQLGDLITEFDNRSILTPEELGRRIQATKARSKVKVKFYRGNTPQTVELTLGHGW